MQRNGILQELSRILVFLPKNASSVADTGKQTNKETSKMIILQAVLELVDAWLIRAHQLLPTRFHTSHCGLLTKIMSLHDSLPDHFTHVLSEEGIVRPHLNDWFWKKLSYKTLGFITHKNVPAHSTQALPETNGNISTSFFSSFLNVEGKRHICQTWNILLESFIPIKVFLVLWQTFCTYGAPSPRWLVSSQTQPLPSPSSSCLFVCFLTNMYLFTENKTAPTRKIWIFWKTLNYFRGGYTHS